ncbi:SRPBCC domain-containing protein [Variovorax dokdonensis]|uniref:SRPBCC domain-containing protein n=1 Tax=Variovorax dokdonensis TaxID=344883 RepID=A0ABT7NDM1_9BURK|nr:SRPBCC domain-containing protein [Variovorax dokdonensis]MDM0046028.1 SRPBCC domain-containing protein [Variovorax dokdonensis]
MPDTATDERPVLRLQREFEGVDPAQVWRAWTDTQALSAWFCPAHPKDIYRVECDVHVGGRFCIGFRMPDGQAHEASGKYLEVAPPHLLMFTWAWRDAPERESLVTIRLSDSASGTRMDFEHAQFLDEAERDSHEGGWRPAFDNLANFLVELRTVAAPLSNKGRKGAPS